MTEDDGKLKMRQIPALDSHARRMENVGLLCMQQSSALVLIWQIWPQLLTMLILGKKAQSQGKAPASHTTCRKHMPRRCRPAFHHSSSSGIQRLECTPQLSDCSRHIFKVQRRDGPSSMFLGLRHGRIVYCEIASDLMGDLAEAARCSWCWMRVSRVVWWRGNRA